MDLPHGDFINDNVVLGGWLSIAARGITPNHKGKQVRAGRFEGVLTNFEHFSDSTLLHLAPKDGDLASSTQVHLPHLEVIEVHA